MPDSSTLDETDTNSDKQAMPDVQGSQDQRRVAINKVGVKDIRYPIALDTPSGGKQSTVATVNMYVSLPQEKKGTHMSRFLEILNKYHEAISSKDIMLVCHDMKQRLNADDAHLELEFPYFIDKEAPISGMPGKLDIEVSFECNSNGTDDFILGIKVPATSLCPCSKEISKYGAHNQRCVMEAKVRFAEGQSMMIEELFEIVEKCASTQVFSVLKRPDEKFVTEDAYENPKFVEDIVRDLAVALNNEDRIAWYQVNSENFESIHNHNAYAMVERDKR
ncbi:GTP cyclohydrolase I [Algisphaera agarilytica]|uniref:GTP cyclohydrolase FolE2 n=2 Tax=Algisphaera agarilytica TaxID=1385975 RepID=A0A7X0LLZ0_9BACT|nr:GTP cyclohydrolase FolE2 [Algisphaera agarilytica]MBB6431522.1 GTP cyclohydrolase I [Algisphaera agarilytica]